MSINKTVAIAESINILYEITGLASTFARAKEILKDMQYALIGGLAVGYFSKPRGTMDVDILLSGEEQLQDVVNKFTLQGFKHTRKHAVTDKQTGAEVELLTPEFLKISKELVAQVLKDTVENQSIKLPTVSALIALKLFRGEHKDLGDIESMLKVNPDVELGDYAKYLTSEQIKIFNDLKAHSGSSDQVEQAIDELVS